MPKITGVYRDRKGSYYFNAATGFNPETGKYGQVTRLRRPPRQPHRAGSAAGGQVVGGGVRRAVSR